MKDRLGNEITEYTTSLLNKIESTFPEGIISTVINDEIIFVYPKKEVKTGFQIYIFPKQIYTGQQTLSEAQTLLGKLNGDAGEGMFTFNLINNLNPGYRELMTRANNNFLIDVYGFFDLERERKVRGISG